MSDACGRKGAQGTTGCRSASLVKLCYTNSKIHPWRPVGSSIDGGIWYVDEASSPALSAVWEPLGPPFQCSVPAIGGGLTGRLGQQPRRLLSGIWAKPGGESKADSQEQPPSTPALFPCHVTSSLLLALVGRLQHHTMGSVGWSARATHPSKTRPEDNLNPDLTFSNRSLYQWRTVDPHWKLIWAMTKKVILEMRKCILGSLWFLMKAAAMWDTGERKLRKEMSSLSLSLWRTGEKNEWEDPLCPKSPWAYGLSQRFSTLTLTTF